MVAASVRPNTAGVTAPVKVAPDSGVMSDNGMSSDILYHTDSDALYCQMPPWLSNLSVAAVDASALKVSEPPVATVTLLSPTDCLTSLTPTTVKSAGAVGSVTVTSAFGVKLSTGIKLPAA